MDKRRNHIIFWVGYFLWYGVFSYVGTIYILPTQLIILRMLLGNTIVFVMFYFFAYFLLPKTLPNRNYFSFSIGFIISLIFPLIFHHLLSLSLNILYPAYFPTNTISNSFTKILLPITRAINLAFPFFLLKIFFFELNKKKDSEKKLSLLKKIVLDSELLGLKAQISPHFFYNILNFLYAQALPFSSSLSKSILNLSEMLRYAIRENDQEGKVSLEQEVDYIKKYIQLENLQLKDDSTVLFNITGNLKYRMIFPMTLQPILENIYMFGVNISFHIEIKGNKIHLISTYTKKVDKKIEDIYAHFQNVKERISYEYQDSLFLNFNSETQSCKILLFLNS
jgi:two-component system, LytTR family, sensor kinase